MVDLLFFSGVAFLLTIVGAYFARFLASFFLELRATNLVGFLFAAGQMAFVGRFHDGGASQASAIAGGLLALVLVWYLFFKRQAS